MRILRVIASMNPNTGGPCQGIRNNIPAQESLGIQSEIVCFESPDADFLLNETLIIHPIGPARGPYAYCRKLENWLKENLPKFDAVIVHGIWLYNSYGTYRIWKQLKRHIHVPKLYIMPHGMLDPYFQKARNRRLKSMRNWIFWKLIENKVINGADGILFTSEQEMLQARKSFHPYSPKAEINIGYGVQVPPKYDPNFTLEFHKKCKQVVDRPYLLFLSRIHPKKGVDDLIKAYRQVKSNMPNVPDLVIAGPGIETNFGKDMQSLAGREKIYFPGMLEGSSKWGAFYGCSAFILPSHQENFGIAVVEALACKKPVLITDKVNIYREIENSGGGLVTGDTLEELTNLLRDWIKIPDWEKMKMGELAGDLYLSQFGVASAASKFQKEIKTAQINFI